MISLVLLTTLSTFTLWVSKPQHIWTTSIVSSIIISFSSIFLIFPHWPSSWHHLSSSLATDSLSSPLIILSCWLVPISLLASINTISKQNTMNQRIFTSLIFIILTALVITFSALDLSLFYIAFETSPIPTLSLISRWGAQKERFQASVYFLFYTLAGSLPLLIALISIFSSNNTLLLPLVTSIETNLSPHIVLSSIWWLSCLLAFVIKMPVYGFHLWLPKAHVEAPIAGSMILAAILLKLGGYGLSRTITIFFLPSASFLSFPLTIFCLWGSLITSIICLRQTDLKALIAYSSVGHMSMVASGIFSLSIWGINGALTLMVAHGLISSALFCLANLLYERNSTRTLIISRGFKIITPLLSVWWLITCVSNLGLPPTPNLLGELLIISAIIDWNVLSFPLVTTATIFSAIYSLMIFSNVNNSNFPSFISNIPPLASSEHLLISLHLAPIIFLIISPTHITL
uniref:NADH-ubiquinone oxidoreductase chain 4 n=1 Tax=Astropecten polyacanthus TaxID=60560 RepID=Q5KSP8_ASTPO|nr:NADH dehydrogenase subunit 4 [Astropecten polyacanthus]BAD86705.1 NADH dehydrogenase subunit 4 [Astropecten polyacanthus]